MKFMVLKSCFIIAALSVSNLATAGGVSTEPDECLDCTELPPIEAENLWRIYIEKGMYHGILHRAPDEGGLAWWLSVTANRPCSLPLAADIAAGFAGSSEFAGQTLESAERIERLYYGILRRPSDFAGKAYWLQAMSNGVALADIARAFVNSPEFEQEILPQICAEA